MIKMEPSNVPHEKSHSASDEPDSSFPDFQSDEPQGDLLFEIDLLSTTNRLVIPFDIAEGHFPPLATQEQPEEKKYETLKFTDTHHHDWDVKLEYYSEEEGFILTGWQKFSTQYNLKPMDLIRIYQPRPFRPKASKHFLIQVVKQEQGTDPPPEFKDENFLFRIKLDQIDIDFNRVFLAGDDVMRNFPAVEMERNSREKKIMRFTDAKCKDWYMDIKRYDEKKYILMEGWDEFVKERGLEAGDLIRFYKHADPCHSKHFLIRIAKKRGTGGPRPGEPVSGSGAGSSSQSSKGKEIAGGD